MAIYLNNIAKRVFHLSHTIRLLVRVIIAQFFHTLFATSGDDALGQLFYVWVLHTNYHRGSKKLANLKKVRILFFLLFNDQGSGIISCSRDCPSLIAAAILLAVVSILS